VANLFILLAFLCEIVSYKSYYNPIFSVDCIYIMYLACLFRLKKHNPSLLFSFFLTGVAAFLNANSVGVQLTFFTAAAMLHFLLIVFPRRKSLGTMYLKNASSKMESFVYFIIIYILSLIIKNILLVATGYDFNTTKIILSFFINIVIFTAIITCIS
jgi:hypothetical protein